MTITDLVPDKQCVDLKEIGFYNGGKFDIGVVQGFTKIRKPTFSEAFDWFKDKYGLQCDAPLVINRFNSDKIAHMPVICGPNIKNIELTPRDTLDEAILDCLKQLIEIVKNK